MGSPPGGEYGRIMGGPLICCHMTLPKGVLKNITCGPDVAITENITFSLCLNVK